MADATKITIIVSFSWLLLYTCFRGIYNSRHYDPETDVIAERIISEIFRIIGDGIYPAICVIIAPMSLVFWLIMKVTGTESHFPVEQDKCMRMVCGA